LDKRHLGEKKDDKSLKGTKRRGKSQIKDEILEILEVESISANELYKRMGYSGNASKTFRSCIEELIDAGKIKYGSDSLQDANNTLIKISHTD
jgi:ATP-dependent DNA helicase RecG